MDCIKLMFNESDNVYKVSIKALGKSTVLDLYYTECDNVNTKPHVVNYGTEDALIFVVKYLNYYNETEEILAPEQPLLDMTIKDIFELEEHIFGSLLALDTDIKRTSVGSLLAVADGLHVTALTNKLAAIVAYNMILAEALPLSCI